MYKDNNKLNRYLIFLVFSAGLVLFLGSGASLFAQDEDNPYVDDEEEESTIESEDAEITGPPGEDKAAAEEEAEEEEEEEVEEETGVEAVEATVEETETVEVTEGPDEVPTPPEEEVKVEAELMEFPEEVKKKEGEAAPKAPKDVSGEVQLDAQVITTPGTARIYQINGIAVLHTNLVSDDYSANDVYLHYYLKLNFNVTTNNRLSVRLDLAQEFIADKGESGLWFGDIRLYYTRKFKIPTWKDYVIPGMAYAYMTAPTSRESNQRSIITKPTVVFALAPSVGPVTFIGRIYVQYLFAKYSSSKMGDPNPQFYGGYDLQVLYQTPLDWLILAGAWSYTWAKDYRTREHDQQLWGAEYYFEFGPTFVIPMPKKGPSLDITLAYAQGSNVLEDGVYSMYFVKRDQSELYLQLNLTY